MIGPQFCSNQLSQFISHTPLADQAASCTVLLRLISTSCSCNLQLCAVASECSGLKGICDQQEDGACNPSLAKLAKLMPGWTDSPMAPIMVHREAEELIKKYKEWAISPSSPEIHNEIHNAFCSKVASAIKISDDG